MANTVPDTNNFTLQDVVDAVVPTSNTLDTCFDEADASLFDSTYKGNKDRQSNFRNWGADWPVTLISINTYKSGTGDYLAVCTDGTYIYAASSNYGIIAYSISGSTLIFKDADGIYFCDVHYYDGFIFAACGDDGIKSYTFDGTSLTLKDTYDNGGFYTSIWGQNGYVFACGTTIDNKGKIERYSYDAGGNFTLSLSSYTESVVSTYSRLWGDGTSYVYVAAQDLGIKSFLYFLGTMILVDTQDDGGNTSGVYGNETSEMLYSAGSFGVRSYTISAGGISSLLYENDTYIGVKNIIVNDKDVYGVVEDVGGNYGLIAYRVNERNGYFVYGDIRRFIGTYYYGDVTYLGNYIYPVGSFGIQVCQLTY
jgi:hypothetical protein